MSASLKNYTPTEGYTALIMPGDMGMTQLYFGILNLSPETTYFDHSDDTEVALVVLSGECTLLVGHNGNKAYGTLGERSDVFQGEASVAYIPHHTTYEMLVGETGIAVAVCKVESYTESAAVILEGGEFLDASETHLRIWEDVSDRTADPPPMLLTGTEALCLHKFRDAQGSAVYELSRPGSKEVQSIPVSHNDVLAVPEHQEIVSSEGLGYRLWVQPNV